MGYVSGIEGSADPSLTALVNLLEFVDSSIPYDLVSCD